jgi:hypothetical protein
MKKFLLLAVLTSAFSFVHAQWHVNLFGGFSNYFGDLQSQTYTTKQGHGAFGAGLQYDLNGHFSILGNASYGKIGAADSLSNKADLRARNLSFQSKIYEGNLLLEYNLFDLNVNRITPYVFAGIALYHFNPYAFDSLGKKTYLKGLSTEGEGLAEYPDRKPYNLFQFSIPFGGGIKFRVTDHIVLAYEIGLRKTFTDYLDDVSTRYVDPAILLNARGPGAVAMAFRGDELKGSGLTYPVTGTVRGNPAHKDWYYFSGIRVSIDLSTRALSMRRRNNAIYDCPKKVY